MADKKVALVTGASRGIGRSITLALAAAGFNVAINYARDRAAAAAVLAEVRRLGVEGAVIQADIRKEEDRRRLVLETLAAFDRLDVLVNNAGVAPKVRTDILQAKEQSFDDVIATNLKGPYFLTQQVANEMIRLKEELGVAGEYQPKIINVTSVSAFAASPSRGEYCISKAGAAMMTKLFAVRLAEYGIGVFEIRPGIIATDMTAGVKEKYDALFEQGITPIARWGMPEDVGRIVSAISTGALPYSTGEVINVDGGFHLRVL